MQLLCACISANPSAADLARQSDLAPLIEPQTLLDWAARHRVAPLLYHHLKRHPPGVFPEHLLQTLSRQAGLNAIKSLRGLQTNIQLARLFKQHDIPYLPLKGVTIAQRYYGNSALRHANDIDFWVPPQAIAASRRLLDELGCRPDRAQSFDDLAERGDRHEQFLRAYTHHDVFFHPNQEHLELHWRLTDNARGLQLDPAALFASAEPVELGGTAMPVMAPVPLLLYLCEHGARHGWYRLKWLADLPQLLNSRDWDWPQVLRAADEANCRTALLLGLRLAEALFGYALPAVVSQQAQRQRLLGYQLRTVGRNLLTAVQAFTEPTRAQHAQQSLYRISIMESFGYFCHELRHHLLSPNDLRIARLPDHLFWAYYPLRPFLLLWRQMIKGRLTAS